MESLEESADAPSAKRKAEGSIRWYKQKFREDWLKDEHLKDWLVRVPEDPYRARCKHCNAELRAGKSELEKHAKTKHHRDMMRTLDHVKAMLGLPKPAQDTPFLVPEEDLSGPLTPVKRPHLELVPAQVNVVRQPKVQCYAPDFQAEAVVDNKVVLIRLSDFQGKYLLLLFHSDVFSLAYPTELVEHSDRIAEFRSLNADVVAVTTDSCRCQLAWTNTPRKLGGLGKINVALLSDFTKQISRDYDVLVESTGYPNNATFVIDPKGVVRYVCVHDFGHPRRVDSALQCLKDAQYIDRQCSQVTGATWEPYHQPKL